MLVGSPTPPWKHSNPTLKTYQPHLGNAASIRIPPHHCLHPTLPQPNPPHPHKTWQNVLFRSPHPNPWQRHTMAKQAYLCICVSMYLCIGVSMDLCICVSVCIINYICKISYTFYNINWYKLSILHPFTLDGKAFCFCFLPGIQPGTEVNRFDTRCALQRYWIILPPQSKVAAGHLNAFRFATSSCSVRPKTSKSYRNIEWFECFKWCFMMLLCFPKCFPIGTRRGKVTQWPKVDLGFSAARCKDLCSVCFCSDFKVSWRLRQRSDCKWHLGDGNNVKDGKGL